MNVSSLSNKSFSTKREHSQCRHTEATRLPANSQRQAAKKGPTCSNSAISPQTLLNSPKVDDYCEDSDEHSYHNGGHPGSIIGMVQLAIVPIGAGGCC